MRQATSNMAISFRPLRFVHIVCVATQLILLRAVQSIDVLNNEIVQLVPKEAIEADFLRWVERVGTEDHSLAAEKTTIDLAFQQSEPLVRVLIVDKGGLGDFRTVQQAVNAVPKGNPQRVLIQIRPGVYKEKVKIPMTKPFITFQGVGTAFPTIAWGDNAQSSGSTFKSATVSVMSDYFIAKNIIFVNTAPSPQPGAYKKQAVAFQISGDKAAMYNCHFYGAQDTLYDHKGRHYFYNCVIQGSIDFIFGDGRSLYEKCVLNAIANPTGSFTAQKRKSPDEQTGFSFVDCKVTGSGVLYLGRAWGAYSRVVYISSYIDAQIIPQGWYNWGDPSRDRTVFYGLYNCRGPGASMEGRVGWSRNLTAIQAEPFMTISFIDGEAWLPAL